MELLKENKKIFIVTGIIFVVLFVGILLVDLFSNSAKVSKLLVRCENQINQSGLETVQRMEFYGEENYRRLIQRTEFIFPKDKDKEYVEQVSGILLSNTKKSVNSLFGETSDVSFSSEMKNNSVEIIIEYKITESNSVDMYQILNLNLYNSLPEEVEAYFVERGFVCEK